MIYKIFVKQTILFIINFYQGHFAYMYMYIYIYIYIYIYPHTRVSSFPGLISVARVNKYIVSKMKSSYSVNTSLVTYQILHTKSKCIVNRN